MHGQVPASSKTARLVRRRVHLSFLQVELVALRQARPRGADGLGRLARPLRRSTRRYSSQRDEFHRMELSSFAIQCVAPVAEGRIKSRISSRAELAREPID